MSTPEQRFEIHIKDVTKSKNVRNDLIFKKDLIRGGINIFWILNNEMIIGIKII